MVNNGSSDAQDFGSATDESLQLREAFAFVRLHIRSVNIYPTGKHASFHSFCTETMVPPSHRNDVRPERTSLSGPSNPAGCCRYRMELWGRC